MRLAVFPLAIGLFPLALYPLPRHAGAPVPCDDGNGGLQVATGFCAVVVAKDLDGVRQITVGKDGIVYGALAKGDAGVVALLDTNGDGRADERALFGPTGANDVKLHDGFLYLALKDRIVRWKLVPGQLRPPGDPETIVEGLPSDQSHQAKSIALGAGDVLYVNVGSPSNSCQQRNREKGSPGLDPCPELASRAGIWQFSASRPGQRQADGHRFATGIRNATAIGMRPGTSLLYGATNGRDLLSGNWDFSDDYNAENPGEELMLVAKGDDYGWPYCYFSPELQSLVLAPEYGGDGKKVGRCATVTGPIMVFPAHWAPLALAFSTGSTLPGPYADGIFIAFHGSWNRAPRPQAGYRVVFAPFTGGKPAGTFTTFATATENDYWLRPSGVAVGPDGAVYISADNRGMIWRIVRS